MFSFSRYEIKGVSEGYSAWALLSMFSRVEYNFRQKYLISANVRRDGSSRFSEDLKCYKCLSIITPNDKSCPSCGWTWEL